MSGAFFGFHYTNQAPAESQVLKVISEAMSSWGPDGGGLYCNRSLALGANLLKVTFEDYCEVLPLVDGPHCLVARVRLDNRESLCAKLGFINQVGLPDSRLILEAYRKFGHGCVEHLLGDWSFALWDESKQTLVIARDASGNTGLYYWWNGKRLVFSSGVKGILAHPEFERQLNPMVLAGILTVYEDPEEADSTIHQGIKKLLPGRLLIARNGAITVKQWWQPLELEPLNHKNLEACYEEFLGLYDEVVGECLRVGNGKVATTLSGGLDSGSVAALAAPRLAKRGVELAAYVHVPLYEPTLEGKTRTGNELVLAQTTASFVGNTRVIPVNSANKTILWGMQMALQIHDTPAHAAIHQYWIYDVLQQAKANGAKVLLTGQMGNATVSYDGDPTLWPELLYGRLTKVVEELRHEKNGVMSAIKHRIIKPPILPWLLRWRQQRANKPDAWTDYSFISPEFAKSITLRERMNASGFDPTFTTSANSMNPRNIQFRLGLLSGGSAGPNWMENGAAYGLDVRDPTRDRRIVEFCWRTQNAAHWAGGIRRGLIRRGMADLLPEPVIFCKEKGLQSADLLERIYKEKHVLMGQIRDAKNTPAATILDLGSMERFLNDFGEQKRSNLGYVASFGRSLQTINYLSIIN
jgi:asparagine synthase (glutamine-hydrolysing)